MTSEAADPPIAGRCNCCLVALLAGHLAPGAHMVGCYVGEMPQLYPTQQGTRSAVQWIGRLAAQLADDCNVLARRGTPQMLH